jgi:predicted DNA-binding transcriptional regulator AlpA
MDDPLVPVEDLAAEVKVEVQTIYNWRTAGKAPRAHRIGRRLFFRRSDIDSWIASRADPERRPA